MEGQVLLLEVGGSCLVLWVIAAGLYLYMMRASRYVQGDVELRAPLMAKEAEEGYNACKTCGFENFKRFPFCSLCGDEIEAWKDAHEKKQTERRAEILKGRNSLWNARSVRSAIATIGILNRQDLQQQQQQWSIPTQRQQRVRKRKEWVRKLDLDGKLFWYRDSISGNGSHELRFPGYAVRFQEVGGTDTKVVEEEVENAVVCAGEDPMSVVVVMSSAIETADPEPEEAMESRRDVQDTKSERVDELNSEVSMVAMDLVDSSIAEPARLPIAMGSSGANMQWRDILSLTSQAFPDKYAHFVTTTARLITPAESELIKLNIKRERIFEDSIASLSAIPARSIRTMMRINFIAEAGVDAGGLHREWFVLLNECLADPATGVFRCMNKQEQTFSLNPNSLHDLGENHLMYYFATGRLIGRALLEGFVMGFHLSLPLMKIVLGLPVTFSDLEYFDPEAYKSLLWLIENDGVESLGLDFSITEKRGDAIVSVDLIPNGRSIDVTDDNKDEYLERRFRYMVFESVSSQLYVFLKGIYEVIPQELLMLFDPEEFDYLLCGSDEIDVDDWERNTKYTNIVYNHPALIWFWELVREMPNEYRRRLLHFATGSSRVPIAGFSSLTSYDGRLCPFTLKGVKLVDDGYIWSHACFNRLDLPLHVSRTQLKAVLYAAIETDVYGFTTH